MLVVELVIGGLVVGRRRERLHRLPDEEPAPVQLQEGEKLCEENDDTELMERLGNVNETCPPLQLEEGQLELEGRRRLQLELEGRRCIGS